MSISQEQLTSVMEMLAGAIRSAVTDATQSAASMRPSTSNTSSEHSSRSPQFSVCPYKQGDEMTVADYFTRFDWALQLSNITGNEHANYARVHMGAELNTALKILISPKVPGELNYDEIKDVLIQHFDGKRNKYAESVKFRQIKQESGESIANFSLRLKNGAVFCEYGQFLDRMLIEQLLMGLECSNICNELIAKQPKNFNEAYEIAHGRELTHYATKEVNARETSNTEQTFKLGFAPLRTKNKNFFSDSDASNKLKCFGCNGNHMRKDCNFKNAKCFTCGKLGHISKVCKSKTAQVNMGHDDDNETVVKLSSINNVKFSKPYDKKIIVVNIDGKCLEMELDTGAPCSIISKKKLRNIKPSYKLYKSKRKFASYTGHSINCIGRVVVNVTVGKTSRLLNLYVVENDLDTLFGREWIAHFAHDINFADLFSSSTQTNNSLNDRMSLNALQCISSGLPILNSMQKAQLEQTLAQFADVFGKSAGKLIGPPIKVHMKANARPIFARPREVPLALKAAYAKEIDAKIAAGYYKKVEYSEWASTTHIVTKKNGALRITGNYKPTVNPQMIIDEHPIPKPEDLFNKIKGATIFAHLDVTDAYTHLALDEEFAHILTLNTTTHGLIQPTRAVYGAANIPAVWQRKMEEILQGLPNIINFFDDILVFARDFNELQTNLELTLMRMRKVGLKLNRSKCVFGASSVEFLGHIIDSTGIHKSNKHIEAILNAPKPTSLEELQLFLGKASYYSSFIPDLATRERPLRDILKRKIFSWDARAEAAFRDIKQLLVSPQVLLPYNSDLPLLLATDASKTGLGAVLSHRVANGKERPIAYASRTMSKTEQRYSQIDKEALAIVWAVQKFFKYLYARHWTLITDHKPLTQILHPSKSLPTLCISRMANYADFLSNFDFEIIYKTSKANSNADYLSRIIPKERQNSQCNGNMLISEYDEFDTFIFRQINQLPVTAEKIAIETRKDPELGKIIKILEKGHSLSKNGYKSPESSYTLSGDCLIFEHRVVIPAKFRRDVLQNLHAAHLGVVKMKGIARSFVYWPKIDVDIENIAKDCTDCARVANKPKKYTEHHWEYPNGPWDRVHIDYAGPFEGMMLLIITDAYSKWLDVKVTASTTAAATIGLIDEVFANYGVPLMIVSDNGTNFASKEFSNYLTTVGVKYHKFTAPYHPSTNGQAERSVQTVKNALKSMCTSKKNLQQNLNEFLRQYKNAPHSTTGVSPAQLFLGRQLRTRLNLVQPEHISSKIKNKNFLRYDGCFRKFETGDNIYFLSENPRTSKWLQGVISKRLGDIHYEIIYQNKYVKRHVDQIRGPCKERVENQGTQEMNCTEAKNSSSVTCSRYNANLDFPRTNHNDPFGDYFLNPNHPTDTTPPTDNSSPSNINEQHDSDNTLNDNILNSPSREKETDEEFETPQALQFKTFPEAQQFETPQLPAEDPFENLIQGIPNSQSEQILRRSKRTHKPRVLFEQEIPRRKR